MSLYTELNEWLELNAELSQDEDSCVTPKEREIRTLVYQEVQSYLKTLFSKHKDEVLIQYGIANARKNIYPMVKLQLHHVGDVENIDSEPSATDIEAFSDEMRSALLKGIEGSESTDREISLLQALEEIQSKRLSEEGDAKALEELEKLDAQYRSELAGIAHERKREIRSRHISGMFAQRMIFSSDMEIRKRIAGWKKDSLG